MTSDSNGGTSSRAWGRCKKPLVWLCGKFTKYCLNLQEYPAGFLLATAVSSFAVVGGVSIWQNNTIIEDNRLIMAPIYFQINEFYTQLNNWISVIEAKEKIANFRIDPLLFLKARLKDQTSTLGGRDNCESALDYSEGNGIGLSKWQRQQLDRLVNLVDILDVRGEIVLHLEGFASKLEFTDFSRDKSDECNLIVANSRAKEVGKYLENKLRIPRVRVEEKAWNRYKDMDQNRYYLYEPRPSIEYPDGLHALNQAVYITISLR